MHLGDILAGRIRLLVAPSMGGTGEAFTTSSFRLLVRAIFL